MSRLNLGNAISKTRVKYIEPVNLRYCVGENMDYLVWRNAIFNRDPAKAGYEDDTPDLKLEIAAIS